MTFTRTLSSAVVALGLVASTGAAFSTAALADYRPGYRQPSYQQRYVAPRHVRPNYYYQESRRDRTGENIAKGLVIGFGALILGKIISESARNNDRYYD